MESWSVIVPFSGLSRGLARINAIQISTWVCKKLFHVYLKNMSWKTNSTRFTQTKVFSLNVTNSLNPASPLNDYTGTNSLSFKVSCKRKFVTYKKVNPCACRYLNTMTIIPNQNKNSTVSGFILGVTNNTLPENKDREEWHSPLIFLLLAAAQKVPESEVLFMTAVALDSLLWVHLNF